MSITAVPERGGVPTNPLTVLDTRLLDDWGQRLAATVHRGGRLLVAGTGASGVQAEQFATQLNGWLAASKAPRLTVVLNAEAAGGTAVVGDREYADELARGVRAHGRPGDVLLVVSASGRSRSLLRAVDAARAGGIAAWGLTGPAPNPLTDACDEVVCVYPAGARALALTATVREAHQLALHLICLSFDATVLTAESPAPADRQSADPESTAPEGTAQESAGRQGERAPQPEAAPPSRLATPGG